MLPLDRRTVERLAKLIVDTGGSFERSGRSLEQLLDDAGWSDAPEYDGSPRVPWLAEALMARRDDPAAVERFLCRVCHPIEYDDDGPAAAEAIRTEVNRLLEPEGLAISTTGSQPVLAEVNQENAELVFSAPPDIERRVRAMSSDDNMVDLLLSRVTEAQIAEANRAYLLALIGIGSFIEGLLLAVLLEHDKESRERGFQDSRGRKYDADHVGLAVLIDTAHRKGWIQLDAKHFVDRVRDYRNFVHPRNQSAQGLRPDSDTLMMCWAPVRAILNDLETALAK